MLGLQRLTKGLTVQWLRRASSSSVKVAGASPVDVVSEENVSKKTNSPGSGNNLVAAAFQSLKDEPKLNAKGTVSIDEKIINAKTVNGLLTISESAGTISRKHALKIVSILAEWSSIKRANISEFENDARFIKVCRVLGRTVPKANGNGSENGQNKKISGFRTDDLNTVLGVAGDDEAAKLIASISLPQMMKVMSALAQKKRRSTPLLRSLAFNISSSSEVLDLKQSADILFAMATLNFKDDVLSSKVCADIQTALPKNEDKSAVVGSILTSLGLLKYRDLDVLESLVQWTLKNTEICRPQDISALFITMAILNYQSASVEQIKEKLVNVLGQGDFQKPIDWLNNVWALTMLGFVTDSHIESVLSESFIKKLENSKTGFSPNAKMKLLNISSYSKLFSSTYKGCELPAESSVHSVPIAHNKSKQILVNGMLDALKSFLPSANHVQSSVNSTMGFLIDAQVLFDSKSNPLTLDQTKSADTKKIALMVVDFHDMCHGPQSSISGLTRLSFDLLERSGFKVLPVPYNEFNTSEKLLKRVQYLDGKLKSLLSSK